MHICLIPLIFVACLRNCHDVSPVLFLSYETDTRLEQERYHLDVPLSVMLNHPAAKPLLQQYMPEMLDNPMLEYMVKNPISAILSYAPQVKPLFEMILKAMNDSEI